MRPKARGLAQHGGPPGWLAESDPAKCTQNTVMSYATQGRRAWSVTLVDPCLLLIATPTLHQGYEACMLHPPEGNNVSKNSKRINVKKISGV